MMTTSLRTLLLLTTALGLTSVSLTACDDKDTSSADTADSQVEITTDPNGHVIGFMPARTSDVIVPTVSGSFLAGQHAQVNNDWTTASSYFEDILDDNPNDKSIQRRAMALSLGAGKFDRAVALAKNLTNVQDTESLATLIVALDQIKSSNYQNAITTLGTIKSDGLSTAIVPLMKAWAEGGLGKSDIATLKDSPSFLYQAVLIADYTNDTAAIKQLAATYDFTKTPTPITGLDVLADIFARRGETAEAESIYTALRNALPERTDEFNKKIAALKSRKSTEIEHPGTTPQQGLASALRDTARLLANGYRESALLFAQMSRMLDPKSVDGLELMAQFSADNRQYDDAISYITQIDTSASKDDAIEQQRQIAMLLELDKQKDEAIRVLSQLVETSGNVDAQIQIGDILRDQEKYKEALDAYNKAVKMMDGNVPEQYWQLLFSRGMTNERLANWQDAEQDLKAALAYEPDQPYILNYLGYTWADQNRNLDKAAEMIEKAAKLKPDDGAIIDSLGWVYYRMGKFREAAKMLEGAVELQPYESEINDHLGDAYWRVGRRNEARFQWKRAISFTKDDAIIKRIEEKIENGLPPVDTRSNTEQTAPAKPVTNGQ